MLNILFAEICSCSADAMLPEFSTSEAELIMTLVTEDTTPLLLKLPLVVVKKRSASLLIKAVFAI